MSNATQPQDVFTLHLRVGLPVTREGQTIYYKVVKLREVCVADERWAVRQAERLVLWQGQPRLVVSDPDHKLALTARHIEAFVCDSLRLDGDLIDLDLIGKLRPIDLAAIEERVFFIELAAKLRFGEITQEQFDRIFGGEVEQEQAPQPVGPASVDGAVAPADGAGPVMLADLSGAGAAGAAAGVGR
jgi:phage FluMu protein gp41